MKNSTMLTIMAVLILLIGGFVFVNGKNAATTSTTVDAGAAIKGQMQQVILSQDGYNYKDATAQAGMPISLSADDSVKGCLRSVVFDIDGKRYSKYLQTSSDVLELPALSKGTYSFSCTMGMGFGKLIVR